MREDTKVIAVESGTWNNFQMSIPYACKENTFYLLDFFLWRIYNIFYRKCYQWDFYIWKDERVHSNWNWELGTSSWLFNGNNFLFSTPIKLKWIVLYHTWISLLFKHRGTTISQYANDVLLGAGLSTVQKLRVRLWYYSWFKDEC